MTIPLITAVIFLSFNLFFVLAEFALIRASVPRLELMQARGIGRAALVLKMVRGLDNYLAAIQVGITMCTLGLGWLGEPAVYRFVHHYFKDLPVLGPQAHIIGTVL